MALRELVPPSLVDGTHVASLSKLAGDEATVGYLLVQISLSHMKMHWDLNFDQYRVWHTIIHCVSKMSIVITLSDSAMTTMTPHLMLLMRGDMSREFVRHDRQMV